jgi:hypothetical protein
MPGFNEFGSIQEQFKARDRVSRQKVSISALDVKISGGKRI